LLQHAPQSFPLAGCQYKPKTFLVLRLPPKRRVLLDIGQFTLGPDRGNGAHTVHEDANGSIGFDSQPVDAAQIATRKHDFATVIEVLVVIVLGTILEQHHFGFSLE
jgi:hypothetical protein